MFSDIILAIMHSLKNFSSDYCDLVGASGTQTLVLKDGTLLSVVRYEGLLSQLDDKAFNEMFERISNNLNNLMMSSGYKIFCCFRKDLDAFSSLARIERVQKESAANLRLNLTDIIDEAIDTARDNVYDEEVYFGLMTNHRAIDKGEAEMAKLKAKQNAQFLANMPVVKDAQNIFTLSNALAAKHNEFVERFIDAFGGDRFHVSMSRVDIIDALSIIRHNVQPNSSPRNWQANVAIDKRYLMQKTGQNENEYNAPVFFPKNGNTKDISYLMPPKLSRQIMSQPVEILGAKEGLPPDTIRCDNRLYTGVVMDIPPTNPAPFTELFAAFNNTAFTDARGRTRTMPWSISFLISGDGLAGTIMKAVFRNIVAAVPPSTNANMKAAYDQLAYLRQNDKAICGVQVSAMTWVDEGTPRSHDRLAEQKNSLKYSMETWGNMKVVDNVGDPIAGWCSNLMGLSSNHVGTKGAAPIKNVFYMLPLTRPASPFVTGTVINRTLDGKLMLLEKFSSLMRTWTKCIVGTPGSGKSVMLNNDLLETCIMAGLTRLPLITVIDKGESSTGFIDLIRDRLPENQQYLAVSKKLRKEKEYAINPLDIKVGLTRPLPDEKTQMTAFLTALFTPAGAIEPYKDTSAFVEYLIDRLFDAVQEDTDAGDARMYQYSENAELDAIVIEFDIIDFAKNEDGTPNYRVPLENISYFALTRKFHKIGEEILVENDRKINAWRGRDLAHRLAMPTLNDLNDILSDPKINELFTNRIDTGETMPVYAKRALASAVSSYPCFAYHTQFDVDTARVVALDLQQVVSQQNPKQSSLFVQIARMIGVKKISLTKEDIELVPDMFKEYYQQQLTNLNADKKVLAIDEMHNYRGDHAFMGLLEVNAREGRKWGLELILASQNLSDFYFPERTDGKTRISLLSFITHLCLCTRPEGEDLKVFREYFDVKDDTTGRYMVHNSTFNRISLGSSGLTYLSCMITAKKKYIQLLTLQVAAKRLWSLTTTAEDRLIRNFMYELTHGDRTKAIAALAYYLPSGAKKRITQINASLMGSSANRGLTQEEIKQKANSMVLDLAREALLIYEAKLANDRSVRDSEYGFDDSSKKSKEAA